MQQLVHEFSAADRVDPALAMRKLKLNHKRNRAQDNSEALDLLSEQFKYSDCKNSYWNPENFSLFYGTPVWDQCSESQRIILNQLYWVAYYAQIISAEIATIFFNQTSAAGLYAVSDFRPVCDTLDLESAQERAHINVFQTIIDQVERELFGAHVFGYPMRGPYVDTIIQSNTNRVKSFWRSLQLRGFAVISSSRAFLASQYFTVRGVRTLNGKIVQHKLSQFHSHSRDKENSPIPSRVSFHHFLDESYHFNSSLLISVDILNLLPRASKFEAWLANCGVRGLQKDHFHFSSVMNGLFWYDPSLFGKSLKILMSPWFGLDLSGATDLLEKTFTTEHAGLYQSASSREEAVYSYQEYLSKIYYLDEGNRALSIMKKNSIAKHLQTNRREFSKFKSRVTEVGRRHENLL